MKQCWPEGDLRAYLDGELPPEARQHVAAHLPGCGACSRRYAELSARAARVSDLMAGLPAIVPQGTPRLDLAPARGRSWAWAALPLAAALAMAFAMLPRHRATVPQAPPTPAVVPAPPAQTEAAVVRQSPVRAPRTSRHPVVRPVALRADFLRLDDEPLETGTVVRVSTENGNIKADLIVGPDGRARAIRLVGN